MHQIFGSESLPLWIWKWLLLGGVVFFIVVEAEKLLIRMAGPAGLASDRAEVTRLRHAERAGRRDPETDEERRADADRRRAHEAQGVREGAAQAAGRAVRLQDWVKHKGLRVIIVFEGRDAAGKGGTIRAITERVSPRVFRLVALPAPSDREKSQMYMQRYMRISRPRARS